MLSVYMHVQCKIDFNDLIKYVLLFQPVCMYVAVHISKACTVVYMTV